MLDAVRQALDGGATIIQLREKNIEGGAFTRQEVCAYIF